MKTEKLDLKSIRNVLSRAEMKKIMAGSGGGCSCNTYPAVCCSCPTPRHSGPPGPPYFISCVGGPCATICEANTGDDYSFVVACSLCS